MLHCHTTVTLFKFSAYHLLLQSAGSIVFALSGVNAQCMRGGKMVSELSAEQRILSDTQQVIKQQVVRDLKIRKERFERILCHSLNIES